MITILTEKPQVAEDIGSALGSTRKCDGYIDGPQYRIVWAKGHLIESYAYATELNREWRIEDLPLIPKEFRLRPITKNGKPDPDAIKQLNVIKWAFDNCDNIIMATDAGREGELIARNIYYYLRCNKPVQRAWISSLTRKSIIQGFRDLRPWSQYDNLYFSARARDEADWKVGINGTRALTLSANCGKTLPVGRVIMPLLQIICTSRNDHYFFEPQEYGIIRADAEQDGTTVTLSTERYYDLEQAQSDLQAITNSSLAVITLRSDETRYTPPPLPHDITSLSQEAFKRLKMTSKTTLDIAQTLYLKKLITYPRTSCRYISHDMFDQIPSLIELLTQNSPYETAAQKLFANCKDINGRSTLNDDCVNDAKLTDHHALLITENTPPDSLTEAEWAIYDLISERMLQAFSDDSETRGTHIEATCGDVNLKVHASHMTSKGWREVRDIKDRNSEDNHWADYQGDDSMDAAIAPSIQEGSTLLLKNIRLERDTTKAPPLLNENTLLEAMKDPGKKIKDKSVRAALKRVGLGTAATRAESIEKLFEIGYTERTQDNKIVPTPLGMSVYAALVNMEITDVATTGKWENALDKIAGGSIHPDRFNEEINQYTGRLVSTILEGDHQRTIRSVLSAMKVKCPHCGKEARISEKGAECKYCNLFIPRMKAGKKLSDVHLQCLMEGGETELIDGFKRKDGTLFNAKLRRDPNTGQIKFIY